MPEIVPLFKVDVSKKFYFSFQMKKKLVQNLKLFCGQKREDCITVKAKKREECVTFGAKKVNCVAVEAKQKLTV